MSGLAKRFAAYIQWVRFLQHLRETSLHKHNFYLGVVALLGFFSFSLWIVSLQPGDAVDKHAVEDKDEKVTRQSTWDEQKIYIVRGQPWSPGQSASSFREPIVLPTETPNPSTDDTQGPLTRISPTLQKLKMAHAQRRPDSQFKHDQKQRVRNDWRGLTHMPLGVEAELEKALAGNAGVQFNFAMAYLRDEWLTRDPVEAYKWLILSTTFDSEVTAPANERRKLERELSPENLQAGRERAKAWLRHFQADQRKSGIVD